MIIPIFKVAGLIIFPIFMILLLKWARKIYDVLVRIESKMTSENEPLNEKREIE